MQFIPVVGSAAAAVVDQYSMYIDIGITLYQNSELEGPWVIDKVTNFQVAQYADLVAKLRAEKTRTTRNLQMLNLMLTEGCPDATHCVSDRRLAQWLQDGLAFPVGTALYEDRKVLAWRKTFYERLLPVRGRLVAYWTYVPASDSFNRAFSREESLGDTSYYGFGDVKDDKPWEDVLLFSSVWKPWANEKWYTWGARWSDRPVAQAWVIGLAGTETEPDTVLVGPTYQHITRALFDPINPEEPLEGGLGLSYKEVACEWLRGYQPSGYWFESKWYHPCHFSFYDPAAATATLTNNATRWLVDDPNAPATYSANANAIAWFAPNRTEVADGRSVQDPDMLSWQIPHLEYGSCADTPWDRSTATGAPASVYFANLTDVAVRVRRINPDGTRTVIPDPDGTPELEVWTTLGHPAAGSGAIPYGATTDAMFQTDSHVGAVYLVQRADTNACIGIYTVGEPPPDAVPYQVAEIHGHGEGAGGILDH